MSSHMRGYSYASPFTQTLVPDEHRRAPKPGHWRLTAGAKHRPQPIKGTQSGPYLPANMVGVATDFRSKRRPTRAELRAAIAAGTLPASAMPTRGGKR
jgi:hypothetical protein